MVENGNDGSRDKDGVALMIPMEVYGVTVAQRGQGTGPRSHGSWATALVCLTLEAMLSAGT